MTLTVMTGLLATAAVAQPILLTGEVRVDAAESRPFAPELALDGRGRGVVVWPEELGGLAARFLDAAGAPEGEAVVLWSNDPIPVPFRGRVRVHVEPVVLHVGGGEIAAVWTEELLAMRVELFFQHETVLDRDVFVQRFSGQGRRLGRRFRLAAGAEGLQSQPALVRVAPRRLLAVWRDLESEATGVGGIYARLLDGKGRPAGEVFRVDQGGGTHPSQPAVAVGHEGELLFVWDACCDGSGGEAVFARLFEGAGVARGDVFRVSRDDTGRQRRSSVVTTPEGAFLVAWEQPNGLSEPGLLERKVFGQVIGVDGAFLGSQRQLSEGMGWGHFYPRLAAADRSILLVWWEWRGNSFPWAIAGIELDGAGDPLGEAFRISSSRTRRQASVAGARGGDFLVSWVGALSGGGLGVATRFVSTDSLAELCGRDDPLATASPAYAEACGP